MSDPIQPGEPVTIQPATEEAPPVSPEDSHQEPAPGADTTTQEPQEEPTQEEEPEAPKVSRHRNGKAALTLKGDRAQRDGLVAIILAVAIGTGLNMFTLAMLWDAVTSEGPGLSENATQVLTGWGGGILGVIGAVVGYQAGMASKRPD